jgi:hypothetical protein
MGVAPTTAHCIHPEKAQEIQSENLSAHRSHKSMECVKWVGTESVAGTGVWSPLVVDKRCGDVPLRSLCGSFFAGALSRAAKTLSRDRSAIVLRIALRFNASPKSGWFNIKEAVPVFSGGRRLFEPLTNSRGTVGLERAGWENWAVVVLFAANFAPGVVAPEEAISDDGGRVISASAALSRSSGFGTWIGSHACFCNCSSA